IKYKGLLYYKKVPKFYENAKALLAPICWEEPCPLAYSESMACGTPVVVFDRGSAKELINDGKTGFVVEPFDKKGRININGFIEKIKKINEIDRNECRKWVEENFTVEKMVDNYEKVFYKIL
ncbi:glycosyltransferase, partial [Patescibacteria group bacterium]|nr:glycosyltransferase [Patescibacteria group bacterium]